jgi:hypothetical protein
VAKAQAIERQLDDVFAHDVGMRFQTRPGRGERSFKASGSRLLWS